ncbi:hypothetical protein [Sediminibacillus albus]|uniref:Uncharacterized protein n=1 Tax=Sediminibacillus albus TaxID=407036 RepID=A0A1G8XAZ8_9BACI|nr:hypothetical protein [Sediminibacillus albus]SDJ87557.1 hypothetical protein SAMN05216243_1256 [Sediminibacillus albus]
MLKKITIAGLVSGTISGVLLGCYLWMVEALTDKQVYTLLLNVDFIPILAGYEQQLIEWLFHVIISWAIGVVYCFYLWKKQIFSWKKRLLAAAGIAAVAAATYFPLTILFIQEIESPDDLLALGYWVSGHALFAYVLAITVNIYCSSKSK